MGERPRRAPEGRRLGKACPASDLPAWHCLGQRDRTMDASSPTEKIERRPSGKAELTIVANDDPATRAPRGHRIIDDCAHRDAQASEPCFLNRQSVVWGSSGAVRVDLGGLRTLKKQNNK